MARSHPFVDLLGGPDVPGTSWLVPSGTLLSPVMGLALAVAVALVASLLLRRHRGAVRQVDLDVVPESAEVRALRLQVRTLTETIDSLATSPATPLAAATLPPVATSPAVSDPVVAPTSDLRRPGTSEDYERLSRRLAREQRLPEAALAQWAADLRLLAPLLDGRGHELSTLIAEAPAQGARESVAAARKLALSLTTADSKVTARLGSLIHLEPSSTATPPNRRTPQQESWRALLPSPYVTAFEVTLAASATVADDARAASSVLRTALIADRVEQSATIGDPTSLLHAILEPHEREGFDRRLAGSAS